MSLSRWKVMAGVLGVSLGGLAAASQCPKADGPRQAKRQADPPPVLELPGLPPPPAPTGGTTPKGLPVPPAPTVPAPPVDVPAPTPAELPMLPAATPPAPTKVPDAVPAKLPDPMPAPATPKTGDEPKTIPPLPTPAADPVKPMLPVAGSPVKDREVKPAAATAPQLPDLVPPAAVPPSATPPAAAAPPSETLPLPVHGPAFDDKPVLTKAPAAAANAAAPKYRILLQVGEGEPRFEVKCGDDLVLKVVCEKVDVKSPEKGGGPSSVSAAGKVRFVGFGAEGTCDGLSFLAGTGEVVMTGAVKVQVKDKLGRVESELSAESMKYKIDGSAVVGALRP